MRARASEAHGVDPGAVGGGASVFHGPCLRELLGEEEQDRVRAAYGEAKYERLRALKRKHDPRNFFRLNQNIRP